MFCLFTFFKGLRDFLGVYFGNYACVYATDLGLAFEGERCVVHPFAADSIFDAKKGFKRIPFVVIIY